MALPIRTTLEDIQELCAYLSRKPTGATIKEAKTVLDAKRLDGRKISALKFWGLIEEQEGRLKATSRGREYVKDEHNRTRVLRDVIRQTPPYLAIIEWAAHRREDTLTTTDVAAHWHEHFKDDVSASDKVLNDEAVCFFQLAAGAVLGNLIKGTRGHDTRFSFAAEALNNYVEGKGAEPAIFPRGEGQTGGAPEQQDGEEEPEDAEAGKGDSKDVLGQAIFIAHGKNEMPLEQLKKILDQFKIPYRVAVEEPNLGRPIGAKVREVMKSCNCAILIFTADEEFKDKDGKVVWRPSENVVYELGATGYLYDNRIVIMKENRVDFPTNFRDIGYLSFEQDQLEARTADILKELVGFGIIKFTT